MPADKAYRLTNHALEEAERRGIALELLNQVMLDPDQVVIAHTGRVIYQSKIEIADKLYLIRVIVERTDPLTVVTVYRTSNIKKYWSDET
jgi:hypothetical protein